MLDSGMSGNFISRRAVQVAGLPLSMKKHPYPLHVVNGQTMPGQPTVNYEVVGVFMEIQGHTEEIDLDVVSKATHDIVLGIPWLRQHNPRIDWKNNVLSLENCTCTRNSEPTQEGDEPLVDEVTIISTMESTQDAPMMNRVVDVTEEKELRATIDVTEMSRRTLTSAPLDRQETIRPMKTRKTPTPNTMQVTMYEEPEEIREIRVPKEYDKWRHLFVEIKDMKALPEHKPWDHKINLQEGKQPVPEPLRPQSAKELEETRKYIDKNLAKGYIQESTSPAGYPTVFVKKKDGTEQFCIDYR